MKKAIYVCPVCETVAPWSGKCERGGHTPAYPVAYVLATREQRLVNALERIRDKCMADARNQEPEAMARHIDYVLENS